MKSSHSGGPLAISWRRYDEITRCRLFDLARRFRSRA
jgi:hypothetical protein